MKKIVAIFGIYLFLLITSQSCEPYHLLITDIRFESATLNYKGSDNERQFNVYDDTTVFTKDIVFIISYHWYDVAQINFGFTSTCNAAFDRGHVFDNKILEDSYSIKFDHSFVYKGDTIPANQNIFDIASIKSEISIFDNYMAFDYSGSDKVIEFSDFFKNNCSFNSDRYNVAFYCKTSDNKEFNKNVNVEFKLIK